MINGVGSPQNTRPDALRATATQRAAPAAAVGLVARAPSTTAPLRAADLALMGAPVDTAKVAAVRAALAEGRYAIDATKIAEAMIDLDLPARA